MFLDVTAACEQVGDVVICDAPGGQGAAVAATLATLEGPVAIVNSDVPCVTPYELLELWLPRRALWTRRPHQP